MTPSSLREHIVDSALVLAARGSWEALRLSDVAADLDITLDDVRLHFREKEEIVDAWFDRADQAMLRAGTDSELMTLPPHTRLHRLLMAWLNALVAHKKVTRQMIVNKFEPGHIHYQWAGLLRVSRTVQWWREAAQRDAVLPRRAVEESVLTSIYLAVFARWMVDDSENARDTAALLDTLLAGAARLERVFTFSATRP